MTLVCKGLLIEESRTNSLLNTDLLSTQIVTVTAAVRTLSFYGTGSVTLSGAHTAVVSGTGAYPTRTTYSFTPTAGALTLTVTGTAQFAQLEAGAFATSYIPTTSAALTRNADVATMTGTNFSDWYNASEGTIVSSFVLNGYNPANQDRVLCITDGASAEIDIRQNTSSQIAFNVAGGASGSAAISVVSTAVAGSAYTVAGAYKTNDIAAAANAGTVGTDSSCAVPVVNQMRLGVNSSGSPTTVLCGTIQKISYFPIRLTNAEIQAFSKG